jgi:hypothetical protein
MYRGQIMDIVPTAQVTKEQLGLLMAGVHLDKEELKKTEKSAGPVERVF